MFEGVCLNSCHPSPCRELSGVVSCGRCATPGGEGDPGGPEARSDRAFFVAHIALEPYLLRIGRPTLLKNLLHRPGQTKATSMAT